MHVKGGLYGISRRRPYDPDDDDGIERGVRSYEHVAYCRERLDPVALLLFSCPIMLHYTGTGPERFLQAVLHACRRRGNAQVANSIPCVKLREY